MSALAPSRLAELAQPAEGKIVLLVLDGLGEVPDPLPDRLRERHGLLEARSAIERIHRPAFEDEIEPARATLRMHEAFVLQAALLQQRAFVRALSATRYCCASR